jgi:hypothetical protein
MKANTAAEEIDDEDENGSVPQRRRSRGSVVAGRWLRVTHAYVSMASMLIVAFFAITGLTLDHPSWTLGSPHSNTRQATLPPSVVTGPTPDYLAISEYARGHLGIFGHVQDYGIESGRGHINYVAPGYTASVSFTTSSQALSATINQGDLLAVLNDVHKGRDTTRSWHLVIDVSAVFLLVVTLTGVGVQLFQRKRRRSALTTAAGFAVVAIVLLWLSTR